ncbi:alpha-N-acetylglucosaminidase [Paenibacillus sp. BC26]|uniref:alpha-N-acetylglucosaminidase n=1 Tax=Paenibacillus sp. BC26 TaxID=1881032 RepID=UPI0008EA46FB|nr:alpha-N-acetylglucosaminidase [Paenibacillus sp. BC26]SFS45864.1 alpha-N-acetylglucosaminidase [Paenibacillus sp. BC26]
MSSLIYSVHELVARLLPKHADQFVFEEIAQENGADVFEIESVDGKVRLRGSGVTSISSAFHWYLKYTCQCHVSWSGDQLELSERLPQVGELIRQTTPYAYRYHLNFCTFSYSMAWWTWERWEREIDWMALHGINMPLAMTGQEAVWMNVGLRLGLTAEQMLDYLPGPAYLAWHYMGNVDGMAGPLPQSWIEGQQKLQLQILKRQRELGMTPVLAGFYGHVPAALRSLYPEANITQLDAWFGMPGIHFLDPSDPVFAQIARVFYEEQEKLYGTDHLYAMDLFHEGSSPDSSSSYMAQAALEVCNAMIANDAEAVWVMQSWSMSEPIVDALPDQRVILLDLYAEKHPRWKKTEAFYGKPWIWCMLHNFGGRNGMHGDLNAMANGIADAQHSVDKGRLCGIGFAPEAIEENPVFYDLVSEMVWRTEAPDMEEWTAQYVRRRYGAHSDAAVEAWKLLRLSVYSENANPEALLCARPKLELDRVCNGTIVPFYNMDILFAAWELLVACGDELGVSKNYQYDLINVGREVMSHQSHHIYLRWVEAFKAGDCSTFYEQGANMQELISDLDKLVGTNRYFLTGPWLAQAAAWGHTDEEKALYAFNARTQISTWWPEVNFDDYAHKQWAGMLSGFYLERWKRFAASLEEVLHQPDRFNEAEFDHEIRRWEIEWMNRTDNEFACEPSGDPVAVSRTMITKHKEMVNQARVHSEV